MNAEPLEVERLVSDDARRPMGLDRMQWENERRVSVEDHLRFREGITPPKQDSDEIDDLLEDIRTIETGGQCVS